MTACYITNCCQLSKECLCNTEISSSFKRVLSDYYQIIWASIDESKVLLHGYKERQKSVYVITENQNQNVNNTVPSRTIDDDTYFTCSRTLFTK